jgi:hypothetical protein
MQSEFSARLAGSAARLAVSLAVVGILGASVIAAQNGRASTPAPQKSAPAKGAPAKAAAPKGAPAPPAPMPKITVAALRIVSGGFGANGSELRPFNEEPGTSVALAVVPPAGAGLVEFDERASRIQAFADDKGQNLLEQGRFGPFPKIAEDGSVAVVDLEVRGRPSPGATSLNLQGTVALTMASGSKPTKLPAIQLAPSKTMRLGTATITVKTMEASEDGLEVTLALSRAVLKTIRGVKFFDPKGAEIESRRSSSGYMNDAAEVEFRLKGAEKNVVVEFDVWQNLRQVNAPVSVEIGLSAGGAAASGAPPSTSSPAPEPSARPAASGPPKIAPGPGEGAATVDAVVKQLQSGAAAGKGKDMLAVIFPDDRMLYGQGVATALAFSTMGAAGDEKALEKAQKDVDALIAKHKLAMPILSKEPADIFKNTDLGAFIGDAMTFMRSQTPKGQDPLASLPVPSGKVENVKTAGDAATATVGGKDLTFAKINGRWFIRLQ